MLLRTNAHAWIYASTIVHNVLASRLQIIFLLVCWGFFDGGQRRKGNPQENVAIHDAVFRNSVWYRLI